MPARAREAQPAEQRQQRDRRASLIILRSIPYIMKNYLQNSMFLATQVSNLAWQLAARRAGAGHEPPAPDRRTDGHVIQQPTPPTDRREPVDAG
jgi:hypothetical protein